MEPAPLDTPAEPGSQRRTSPPASSLGILPGLAVTVAVALAGRLLHDALPAAYGKVLGEVIFAVSLGFLIANTIPLPAILVPGIRFAFRTLLRAAIVVLGAGFSFGQIAAIGGKALGMIAVLMATALSVAHFVGKRLGVRPELATLIGVGTAVCGNSAISATAPVIGARDEDVSFAIATNTLLGTVAVVLYPAIARAVGMSDAHFGTWAGLAINDTSQVVAAGFAVSDAAGRIATAVKLTRNALMGPIIVLLGLWYARAGAARGKAVQLSESVPLFVVGFLAMALLNTLGGVALASEWAGRDLSVVLASVARFLILVALAGVGLGTSLQALRRAGARPFWLGVAAAIATSLGSLALIRFLGPAAG